MRPTMGKKIDFFSKDNVTSTDTKSKMKRKTNAKSYYGSKTSNVPKKRGRRPKKILENVVQEEQPQNNIEKNSAVILRLHIDPSKLKNMKTGKPKKSFCPKNDNSESSDDMFKNDIPRDSTCPNCSKNEKLLESMKSKLEKYESKERIDKSNKVYNNDLNFISYSTGKAITIKKTKIKCWWDCHPFSNLPFALPELRHDNKYYLRGCFCSPNCALAYNLYHLKDSKIDKRKSLVYILYREMYGLKPNEIINIKEAPPRELLEDFGGSMGIDTFRKTFIMMDKEYIVYIPPIRPINMVIEEKNVLAHDESNDKDLVLKRSKPLSKKRSVIASMKFDMKK